MWQNLRMLGIMLVALALFAIRSPGQDGKLEDKPADESSKLVIPNQLRVATREVPPFAMQDEEGQWSGISFDLLREVKAALES